MPSDHSSRHSRPESHFLAAFEAAPAGTRAVVMDLGANRGDWARLWRSAIRAAPLAGKSFELYFFEPQPVFKQSLSELAQQINATFLPFAVGSHKGYVHMVGQSRSTGAMAVELAGSTRPPDAVPLIDVAAWMRSIHLSDSTTMAFMKLDVEGMEYQLLPWLLSQAHNTLCALHSMIIEWHLLHIPASQRLEALGLELSFLSQLRLGCPPGRAPVTVYNEKYFGNQFGMPVPGLLETFLMYAPWQGRYDHRGHAAKHDTKAQREKMAAEAEATTPRRARRQCAARKVACRSNSPFGENVCLLDSISCDPFTSYNMYMRAMLYPINASGHADCTAGLGWPPWMRNVARSLRQ